MTLNLALFIRLRTCCHINKRHAFFEGYIEFKLVTVMLADSLDLFLDWTYEFVFDFNLNKSVIAHDINTRKTITSH